MSDSGESAGQSPDQASAAPPSPERARRNPHDVFLSYSSKNKAVADAVCATLERRGLRCWMAPRDIMPGAEWAASIVQAINDARAFVLIFSAFANTSAQVKREVERAANQGLPIIPFRIDDVAPNQTLEFFISTPHWLDALTPPIESHAEHLARVVGRLLDDKPPADAAEAERERSYTPRRDRRRDEDAEDEDEAEEELRRRLRRRGHGAEAREGTREALRALRRLRRRRQAISGRIHGEVTRAIVQAGRETADALEGADDERDDRPPDAPALSSPLALALGLALFVAPQLIVPMPAAEAWRFAPLFIAPVAVSLWGQRYVSIVGGALLVVGALILGQSAAQLAARVFTYLPGATDGRLEAGEVARIAAVGAAIVSTGMMSVLMVFGRRLASPAAMRTAITHSIGLTALAGGLGYGFAETQARGEQAWLAFIFYGIWLLVMSLGLILTARAAAVRAPRVRGAAPPTDNPRPPRRHNNRQVWLIALLTLVAIEVVTVVTVGPPIPWGPRSSPAAPPF